jgi:serine/threonine-protein kinase
MKRLTSAVHGFSVDDRLVYERRGPYASGDMYDKVINRRVMRYEVMRKFRRSAAVDDASWIHARRRFWKDAIVGSTLRHPNLIRVFDYDLVGDELCLTMQAAFYGSMQDWMPYWVSMYEDLPPIDVVVGCLEDVARGLEAMHNVGVIHRNVKPSNVLLMMGHRALVGDFGHAQVNESFFSSSTEFSRPWNEFIDLARPWINEATTQHPGSPDYMSPEHFKPAPLEPTSDVYSLGCVAFELLTGKRYAVVKEQVQGPLDLRVTVPYWLNELVKCMLAEDANRRFKSMTQVIESIVVGCAAQEVTQEQELRSWQNLVRRQKQAADLRARQAAVRRFRQ